MANRQLLQIVEIDVEQCSLTYGTGACGAVLGTTGNRKCFNFVGGCQDRDNFTSTVKTLRYAMNQDGLPTDVTVYPAMVGPVNTREARISIGGVLSNMGPLGRRATVTANFKDFLDSDLDMDKYQAERKTGAALSGLPAYDPATQGTHFGRLRKRFPYYTGRAMRVKEGYVGQPLADMVTRQYVITEWTGPDADGNVSVMASDVLDFGDYTAPKTSSGQLYRDLETDGTYIRLTPSGVGGSEYPASGKASIGREIVSFTRSGDKVTITGRGLDGSDVSKHSAGDVFQLALVFDGKTLPFIAKELMNTYAGVDLSLLDYANWEAEIISWFPDLLLSTVIAKPVKVKTLVSELALHGVLFYQDDLDQVVKMRADRPADAFTELFSITDDTHIIEGSSSVTDMTDSQVTRAVVWHDVIDQTEGVSSTNNFKQAAIAFDPDAESVEKYNGIKEVTINSRWVLNSTIANIIAQRLVIRFAEIPKQITFETDVKDRDLLQVASVIMVTSRLLQDEDGASYPVGMQITAIEETIAGHKLNITAQSFAFIGNYGRYMTDGSPSYLDASDLQKRTGCFYAADTGKMSDGSDSYVYF